MHRLVGPFAACIWDKVKISWTGSYSNMHIAEFSKGNILQYFWPPLNYHFPLRPWSLSIFKWPLKTGFTVCWKPHSFYEYRLKGNICHTSNYGGYLFYHIVQQQRLRHTHSPEPFPVTYRNIKSGMLKTSEFFMGSICHKYINMADTCFMTCPAAMDSLQPLAACLSKY